MGKMGKKTKSDRINALRKQYDAFLEEDKKRKERNEFILGQLDKMRYSTTMVPIRHKGKPQVGEYLVTQEPSDHIGYDKTFRFDGRKILSLKQPQLAPSCTTKEFAEPIILKEISKKYILIPKLQHMYEDNKIYYNSPNESSDNDWRSKYNILEELKKNEKEGKSDQENSHIDDKISIDNQKNMKENSIDSKQIHNEFPVSNSETSELNLCTDTKNYPDENIDCQLLLKNEGDIKVNDENSNDINKIKPPILDSTEEINDLKCKDEIQQKDDSYLALIDNNQKTEKNNNNEHEVVEQNKSQDLLSNSKENLADESNNHINTLMLTNNETIANSSSPNIIDQSGKTHEIVVRDVETVDDNESVIDDCGAVGNPILTTTSEKNYDPDITTTTNDNNITSQIEDFESEQKEMFYSNENTYNESNIDTNAQNEEYANEQYSYYNESQEQPYYTEVNEHEESTERYDPNYRQQYDNNYEENIAYGNQQYEVNDTYEHHQELLNENYEQQLPGNYEYVSPETTNIPIDHTTDENTYENQVNSNVSYENQEYNINSQYEQVGVSDNLENHDQTNIENTNEHENPISDNLNSELKKNEVEEQHQLEQAKVLNTLNTYENEEDDGLLKPDVETIQNIEKQLDEEDDFIESNNIAGKHPEILRREEPDVNMT